MSNFSCALRIFQVYILVLPTLTVYIFQGLIDSYHNHLLTNLLYDQFTARSPRGRCRRQSFLARNLSQVDRKVEKQMQLKCQNICEFEHFETEKKGTYFILCRSWGMKDSWEREIMNESLYLGKQQFPITRNSMWAKS